MNNQINITTIFNASVAELFELTAELPCRIIQRDGQPYLERYFVSDDYYDRFLCIPGYTYIHRFVGGGEDEALHDHPWPCSSDILHGHYTEKRLVDANTISERKLTPVNRNIINLYQPHQICNPAPETWTLFRTKNRERSWNFYTPIAGENAYKMINYKDYLNQHDRDSAGQRARFDWWNANNCPTGSTADREHLAKNFQEKTS